MYALSRTIRAKGKLHMATKNPSFKEDHRGRKAPRATLTALLAPGLCGSSHAWESKAIFRSSHQVLGNIWRILPSADITEIHDNHLKGVHITAEVLPDLLRLHIAHLMETPKQQPKSLPHTGISTTNSLPQSY